LELVPSSGTCFHLSFPRLAGETEHG
jgi:hypothetical protein